MNLFILDNMARENYFLGYTPFPAKVQDDLWVETDRPTNECKPTHNIV